MQSLGGVYQVCTNRRGGNAAAVHHVQHAPEPRRPVTEFDEIPAIDARHQERRDDSLSRRLRTMTSSTGGGARLGASCSLNPTRCRRLTLVPPGSSNRSPRKNERLYRMTCPGNRRLTLRCETGGVATISNRHPV
jgi:hypothetical protein